VQSSRGVGEDASIGIQVRLENETVWLTQKLMAGLFQKEVRTINEHIRNIYAMRISMSVDFFFEHCKAVLEC
jgi:hypothetical protein